MGLEHTWERVDLRSAMRLAYVEATINADAMDARGRRPEDSQVVLGVLAAAGIRGSPIFA